MPTIIIDNREFEIPGGVKLNCIQAAKLAGVEIPHYCWHPGLSVVGSCRMCLVEVGSKDAKTGKIAMQPKLVPACNQTAVEGTVIVTNSEKVARTRAMVEEDLLLRHPIDCPICDKAGECSLQDYHFAHGQDQRRADLQPFTSRRRDIGDVSLFVDRCILCSRCVRFAKEISGTSELMVAGRGTHEEIDVVENHPLHNNLSGNVVDLCPVGALADKDFLYRQRVWFLRRHKGICTGCATGCSIWIEENQDRIHRLKPRENPHVNQWWMCNEGRYGYPHVHSDKRIVHPIRHQRAEGFNPSAECETNAAFSGNSSRGDKPLGSLSHEILDWTDLPTELNQVLRSSKHLGAILSPFLAVEEAYLLCKMLRGIDKNAMLALGPIPVVGEDEHFPKGFTVRAEKCPNRRGVENVLTHFTGKIVPYGNFLKSVEKGEIRGVWVAGGYKNDWIDEPTAKTFESVELLIVQDLFPSPLSERASFLLPVAAFVEIDGSYVNHADRLQTVPQAIRPPLGVRSAGSLLWEMSGRKGLYDAQAVLREAAHEILYFSAAAGGVPEAGIDLKSNLLAGMGKIEDSSKIQQA
ncbi:MAG: (2Fe-2S)-binding protein [Pirellulales bacterium]|nr:(2Fe-2S)-binding protein [Pirellulales bacterium]